MMQRSRYGAYTIGLALILGLFLTAGLHSVPAVVPLEDRPSIDVLDYTFEITLTDTSDHIYARATIIYAPITRDGREDIWFNLVGGASPQDGMVVEQVTHPGGVDRSFTHASDTLRLAPDPSRWANRVQDTLVVSYSGIPKDGLIISQNRHGDRTFFGDQWPNRARHWLASVDHPSDKATVTFEVTAPSHYQVIANGRQVASVDHADGTRMTRYRSTKPLPMKVTVIGVAAFHVAHAGNVGNVPVTSWTYPQDAAFGLASLLEGVAATAWFEARLGAFPYEKLANVQSTTRYGGMENAGAIFYFEGAFVEGRDNRSLIAHEIAHQWFGNSVTEADWSHLWLSEGFATFLAHEYMAHLEGEAFVRERRKQDRERVIRFAGRLPGIPLVDARPVDPTEKLNTNAYQKGGWVLHMLRQVIGQDAFYEGLRAYQRNHAHGNATSSDLQAALSQASGQDLAGFFDQWVYQGGHPVITTEIERRRRQTSVLISETSGGLYDLRLDVDIVHADGTRSSHAVTLERGTPVRIPAAWLEGAVAIELDPAVRLLYEGPGRVEL